MAVWHDALREYRRGSLDAQALRQERPVMFALCSESRAGARLVAAFQPAIVLQTLGGAVPADPGVRATFEYGIGARGVRHVVLCGHTGCRAHGGEAQANPGAQAQALLRDEGIGPLLRASSVKVTALWFDEEEGDIFGCDVEGRRRSLMSDEDVARMLAGVDEPRA